jgi:serine/threonine protein kinase
VEKPTWIGQTLGGRYRIEEVLGQGGMSAVYKATDPNLKRIVAIKLIHPHLSIDPAFVQRFESEAAAVASLRHSNIVQVFDFNNESGVYYMVLEFIPGETLQDRLKRLSQQKRTLSVEEALGFTLNIADAVGYAHQRGMVHRDIKPANIMLDDYGQAILMDFGIVKIVGGDSHTSTGAVVGTALYISPELVRGEVADQRSDIYSLGVTLYEMLSGRPPFMANSAMTLMMMHVNDPVPDVRGFRPGIPTDVVNVISKCLAKDRNERYSSAHELAEDLRQALGNLKVASTSVSVKDTSGQMSQSTMVSALPPPTQPGSDPMVHSNSQTQLKPVTSPRKGFKTFGIAMAAGFLMLSACALLGINYYRTTVAAKEIVPTENSVSSTITPFIPITANTIPASTVELPKSEPTVQNVVEVQHIAYPSRDAKTGSDIFDVYSSDTAAEKRAPYGDSYDINLLERPFLQDMTYVPDLDIKTFSLKQDDDWYYVTLNLIGTDPNNPLGIDYGVDLDEDRDGFGDTLILSSPPYSTDWQTGNVRVLADKNHDSAGKLANKSDAPLSTDGYESLVFDGMQGVGDDIDLAWVRIAGEGVIQFAFKRSLAGDAFMFGVLSDAGLKDVTQLDYVDRFTSQEAGSPIRGKENYPLRSLYATDNTCRSPFGFSPTEYEKRLCPKIIIPAAGDNGNNDSGVSGCQPPPGGCGEGFYWWPDPHCACSATPYNG